MKRIAIILFASILLLGCKAETDCVISKYVSSGDLEKIRSALQDRSNASIVCEGRNIFSVAAASFKGYESAKLLLSAGINPSADDSSGSTPLHEAAMWADLKMVRLLVDHGVDPNKRDRDGATPLDLAKARSDQDGLEIAEYLEANAPRP